jgi:hypothetical protein
MVYLVHNLTDDALAIGVLVLEDIFGDFPKISSLDLLTSNLYQINEHLINQYYNSGLFLQYYFHFFI